jgi:hypothetical protein
MNTPVWIRVLRPLLTTAAILVSAPGCASRESRIAEAAKAPAAPADFALAITVVTPIKSATQPQTLPRAQRPARYILEPDGTLRIALGGGSTSTTYPPPTRLLSDARREDVWNLVKAAGLLEPEVPGRLRGTDTSVPLGTQTGGEPISMLDPTAAAPKTPTALIVLSANGVRDFYRIAFDESPNLATLTDRLAAYGWVRE